ncbi:helix-turn-helix domain-containing protein [Mesorhizobium sp. M1312]|uniref:GlxA family transcriptional regulator n=1 Tax=unclassified Mesorhizobium TaxID=325217 RepID=UPI00333C38F5
MAFIDPFRAANYLEGETLFQWKMASSKGGACLASNGVSFETLPLKNVLQEFFDIVVVSSSWTPETVATPDLLAALRRWARAGSLMAGLDTGAFILAEAGLLVGKRATVHYEHLSAFQELNADVEVSEDIVVRDGNRFTCSGGIASCDMALHIIDAAYGSPLAKTAAYYIFHPGLRQAGVSQNPGNIEAVVRKAPEAVRRAISIMENHVEDCISIPEISSQVGISPRQLHRLFERDVGKSPALYYRDVRLDRARGFVTQTDMLLYEIAIACGFRSQVHFSRAYRARFGIQPSADRVEGRIPFEFRAWPLHRRKGKRLAEDIP